MCHQRQASKFPSHKIKKVWLDDSNSSRATLSFIRDRSVSFGSLALTPFRAPQFTSMPGKVTTEARAHLLSRDSNLLAGPHDQTEVFPMNFGWSLPPTMPIPSISGSQGPRVSGFCQLSGEEAVSKLQALAITQEILHKP